MVTASGASPRASDQSAADAWGSRSTIALSTPASLPATARWTATVVLPAPPFSLTIERTFILATPHIVDNATGLQRKVATCQQRWCRRPQSVQGGNQAPSVTLEMKGGLSPPSFRDFRQ